MARRLAAATIVFGGGAAAGAWWTVVPNPAAQAEAANATAVSALAGPALAVWKSPTCGCCGGWIDHVRAAGFAVSVHDVADPWEVKSRLGVPEVLGSCHTAMVDGYVIEGHVPAADIVRLLKERPAARGLAVPGMPQSAPGMDIPGHPYEVLMFDDGGGSRSYTRHSG